LRKNQYGREDVCARVMSPQFLSVAAASWPQQEKIIIKICILKQKKSHSTNNARLTKHGLLKNLLNNPNYSISLSSITVTKYGFRLDREFITDRESVYRLNKALVNPHD